MMMQKLFHYVVLTLIRTTAASSIPFISRVIWNALSETMVEASTENVLKPFWIQLT